METEATARYIRMSPTKVREVVDLIRRKDVQEARRILTFSTRAAGRPVLKVLESAIANAENNFSLDPDELFVRRAFVDEGPILKRWRPRARGRATRIRKRTSHITVYVGTEDEK
jgi:large subunit ribosomal protein L22